MKINYSFTERIHGSYEERTLSNKYFTSSELVKILKMSRKKLFDDTSFHGIIVQNEKIG